MGKKKGKNWVTDNLQEELDLISYEYSIDNIEQGVVKIYLTTSVYATYEIIIDFKNYPEKPTIKYDDTLNSMLGTPEESLHILKKWNEIKPQHIVEITHEIEGLIMSSSVLDKIGEQLSYRYNTVANGPKKVRIIIDYENQRNFEFDISYKTDPPIVELSLDTSKFIKLSHIKSLQKWDKNSSVIGVVDEIAIKLEHRLRVFYEMKDLKPFISGVVQSGTKIVFNVAIDIETGESFEFEFELLGKYPKQAPNITLISRIENQELMDRVSEFITYQVDYWDKNKHLLSVIEELKEMLHRSSEKVCALCHNYICPTCNKKLTLGIEGVSGTSECKHICQFCGKIFHNCCWLATYKLTHQCPICLKSIKRI